MNSTVLGLVAGAMTTGAFLPQIYRVWRLRRAEELSWGYLGAFGSGICLWLAYGVIRHDLSIVCANAITVVCVGMLVWLKVTTRGAGEAD